MTTTRLRHGLLISVCLLGITATRGSAQTPAVPSSVLAWTVNGAGGAQSFYSFLVSVDGGGKTLLAGVTCAPDANLDLQCEAPLPAMTPGRHVIALFSVFTSGSAVAESESSPELALTLVVVVAPSGLRVK